MSLSSRANTVLRIGVAICSVVHFNNDKEKIAASSPGPDVPSLRFEEIGILDLDRDWRGLLAMTWRVHSSTVSFYGM